MKYFSLENTDNSSLFTCVLVGILGWILAYNSMSDLFLTFIAASLVFLLLLQICLIYRQIFLFSILVTIGAIIWTWVWYHNAQDISENSQKIDVFYGLYSDYTGEVHKVYRRSDFYDEYVLELESVSGIYFSGNVLYLLRVPKNFILEPEQKISHSWVMYPLEDFDGFAYNKFMLSQNIYFSTSSTNLDTLSHNTDSIKYKMYTLREGLLNNISDIFPSRESIFLGWILFWARENIPSDLKEDFNNSWLTHFIAVSGFNITLCIIFMTYIFGFLPRYIRSVLVIISIVAFSFFVWLWAPVVRAAIMWALWYIFLQSWNKSNTLTLIAFTAVLMGLFSPLSLNYDVSLHLSFLAVIGIVYTQEIFSKLFSWIPSTFAIREAFVLTLSALSFSLPIMMFQFWQISLLAPIANIAVTWTIPLAMLWGSLTLIGDYFSFYLGQIFWFITWILLRYDIAMVEYFWNIEGALLRVDFGLYAHYLQILYFLILTYILIMYNTSKKKNQY